MVLLPILWPEELPDQTDCIRALLYNPPPPPPPPLPKGTRASQKQEVAKPTTPDPSEDPEFVEPETPKEEPRLKPEDKAPEIGAVRQRHGERGGVCPRAWKAGSREGSWAG